MVKHAKLFGKINDIFLGKSCLLINYTGKVDFIGLGGGQVGEGVEVVVEGIDLLLNRGKVNRDGDVDIGRLGCNFANRIKEMW